MYSTDFRKFGDELKNDIESAYENVHKMLREDCNGRDEYTEEFIADLYKVQKLIIEAKQLLEK